MSDRLILELKNNFKNEFKINEDKNKDEFLIKNSEINKILGDLQLTLKTLNYTKREIESIFPIIIKEKALNTENDNNISFESLLKLALNYLDNDSSNKVR